MSFDPGLAEFNDNPLYRTLGLELTACGDGRASSTMRPPETLCWPFQGQPHGGVLFTQIDTTLAMAMLPGVRSGYSCATIDMDIQFTQRAQHGPFTCHAEVTHRARKIAFGRAQSYDAQGGVVAIAQGTFRLIEPRD